ncbi:polygalacturonase [Diabrotica virgifera virgifera]|uniref:Polygalacturonase-like n=1 Tax=Diabrotica virgifera virgifera TaxID=50390 RepID=A0ABM5IXK1_DIAVI|nr:polygalacturonase [Diabrotica virgifera virgifera]
MRILQLLGVFFLCSFANALNLTASCTISKFQDVNAVVSQCKSVNVGSFEVPAGQTLTLHLQAGTTLSFNGNIDFGYKEWDGPLMWIKGDGITVQGSSSHLLNGRGELWWDGHGDHSNKKKPQFMLIQATGNSVFKYIKVKNCPHTCIGISDSHDLTLDHWTIDSKDGDTKGGANTDGFDIAKSYKVTIKDTNVWNQDDCICVNQGQHLIFQNIHCIGGHGLSLAAGMWSTYELNTIYNVTFKDSIVENSRNAIHIKTIPENNKKGEISLITYDNIKLIGISYYAINVQEDYTNDGPTGHPLGNIPIKNLKINNVYGTMTGSNSVKAYILCGSGGCSNWNWSNINVSGAAKSNSCNFTPNGFNC